MCSRELYTEILKLSSEFCSKNGSALIDEYLEAAKKIRDLKKGAAILMEQNDETNDKKNALYRIQCQLEKINDNF